MGLIADLDFPHVVISAARKSTRVSVRSRCLTASLRNSASGNPAARISSIMRDTPLVPRAAAAQVLEEASGLLDEQLPLEWILQLVARAEATYESGAGFRRRIRSLGNEGREWLWAFMRHWLAEMILREKPAWFGRLPAGYATGGQLK